MRRGWRRNPLPTGCKRLRTVSTAGHHCAYLRGEGAETAIVVAVAEVEAGAGLSILAKSEGIGVEEGACVSGFSKRMFEGSKDGKQSYLELLTVGASNLDLCPNP